ncbi:restriction endonuclease subunit S [Janthinobacterium lividum]|uniref:restriction endonuclease subunit S n=1 Tax=Janthinobacterium lividum TaxID=29581 RepID=UPI00087358B4|nr:restriction endonuclease subunit S [Janthinobacterium lividum]MCC7714662.1 restriction endonuclease subunit S [Janthinobacterium lividum]OEZ56085.1 putative type I restriction enzyme specificity protein [Janthinobacterium lividum]WQE30138.1 restriction endonuclease subunit S [Janthinobacterium lividum]STQ95636.1 Putative type I restriction enzyme specificity protein MPN_638 [Janthinobacterium lividum]
MLTKPILSIAKRVSSGLTPLRSNPEFWENGTIPWLKTEQLGEKFIYSTTEKISKAALDKTSIKVYPINTLSVAMYGEGKTRGNVSIIKNEMATNQACCNIELDPELADFEYVYYFLKTQYNELRNLSSGVRKNLNSNDIKNFVVRLPKELSAQKSIAAVLSTLDTKIDCNNRINAELEALADMLYGYWFMQFDFPCAKGKPYKSSGGKMSYNTTLKREVPVGWKDGTLDDLGRILGGSTPSTDNPKNFSADGVPWITPYDLSGNQGNKFITRGAQDVSDEGIKAASLKKMPAGSVLLSSRAPIGYMAIARAELTTNQGFKSFIPSSEYSTAFIYYTIKRSLRTITQYASGSTFKEVSATVLKTVKIVLPDPDVVAQFTTAVAPIFERQDLLEQESVQLGQLRDWLLPMLMNGQIKVA